MDKTIIVFMLIFFIFYSSLLIIHDMAAMTCTYLLDSFRFSLLLVLVLLQI